jgi:hypothetical protein
MQPPVLAMRLLSRRSFVLSPAAAAAGLLRPTSARAQGDVWREYRPADQPFRIEMPGCVRRMVHGKQAEAVTGTLTVVTPKLAT